MHLITHKWQTDTDMLKLLVGNMEIRVEILTLDNKEKWNNYISKLPKNQQDIYFTSEYYKLYKEYGDGETFCFIFKKGSDIAIYPFFKNPVDKETFKLDKQYFDIQGAYGYNGVISSNFSQQIEI